MAESQNIEYKESWRDEYLKWICGFANAQGGTIYIGIDDTGNVVGVKNIKKLMEDIPNKIQSGLGVVAEVNKFSKKGLDYIEIKVEPSSFPVSYHGEYHYRSGSTKQQLTGIALSEFIMRKTGIRWEAVREAVYNAIAHNCYMFGTPIQIRIEDGAMIISNRCILPEGWTVETLMQPHDSIPYNPDIANVFYRAGYIEHWGRGIEKICDECKELGVDLPVYELRGNGLRVSFKALQSALIRDSKTPKRQIDVLDDVLGDRIMKVLRNNPKITQTELAKQFGVPYRSLQRKMDELKATGCIERIGGKRYGKWIVKV